MKLISFYCDVDKTTYYSDKAIELKSKCEKIGVDHLIIEKKFGDTWIDNVKAKPIFLRQMLETLNEDFIWLDVDADILKKVDFDLLGYDWMFDIRFDNKPHDYVHIIKNNEENKIFIDKWIDDINKNSGGSHSSFINMYKLLKHNKIPKGYFDINNLSNVKSKENYFKNNGKI